MKRILLSIAAGLICLPLLSQEADGLGNFAELHLVPRIEGNPYFSNSENGFSLGNTSLYTFLDGNLSENLSFSFSNHWVALEWGEMSETLGSLYKNSFRSDDYTWCDWANLTYSFNNFEITVGKDCSFAGGWENDANDVDCHLGLCSTFWDTFVTYQWGGSFRYTLPSEKSSFALQVCSSPYGEKPFASGLYMYSAQWLGNFEPFMTKWAVSLVEEEKGQFFPLVSLGTKLAYENGEFGFDYMNALGDYMYEVPMMAGRTLQLWAQWSPSDKWDLIAKGLVEGYRESKDFGPGRGTNWRGGGGVHFYPLRDSKALRLHLIGSYDSLSDSAVVSFGATFDWTINIK